MLFIMLGCCCYYDRFKINYLLKIKTFINPSYNILLNLIDYILYRFQIDLRSKRFILRSFKLIPSHTLTLHSVIWIECILYNIVKASYTNTLLTQHVTNLVYYFVIIHSFRQHHFLPSIYSTYIFECSVKILYDTRIKVKSFHKDNFTLFELF